MFGELCDLGTWQVTASDSLTADMQHVSHLRQDLPEVTICIVQTLQPLFRQQTQDEVHLSAFNTKTSTAQEHP